MTNDIKYIIKRVIIGVLIAVILSFIFTFKVNAATTISYNNGTKTINNTTYYGYNLPTRLNISETFNGVYQYNNSFDGGWDQLNRLTFKYNLQYSSVFNNTSNNNVSFYQYNNSRYHLTNHYRTSQSIYLLFQPGMPGTTEETLSYGGYINYDNYYDFKFNISIKGRANNSAVIFNYLTLPGGFKNGTSTVRCLPYLLEGGYGRDINTLTVQYQCKNMQFTSEEFNTDDKSTFIAALNNKHILQGFRYAYSENGSFNCGLQYGSNWCNSNDGIGSGVYGDIQDDVGYYEYVISAPYDLVMYAPYSSYVVDKIWTETDTAEINENPNNVESDLDETQDNFIDKILSGASIDDGGISSIILHITNIIRNKINTSCNNFNIPILGKNIILPNGCTFWNRQDMREFNIFYQTFIISLLIIGFVKIIYNDFIKILNPNITTGDKVVDL